MGERHLDVSIENGKRLPENIRQVAEPFASSDQKLAEIGLGGWLADFDKKYHVASKPAEGVRRIDRMR